MFRNASAVALLMAIPIFNAFLFFALESTGILKFFTLQVQALLTALLLASLTTSMFWPGLFARGSGWRRAVLFAPFLLLMAEDVRVDFFSGKKWGLGKVALMRVWSWLQRGFLYGGLCWSDERSVAVQLTHPWLIEKPKRWKKNWLGSVMTAFFLVSYSWKILVGAFLYLILTGEKLAMSRVVCLVALVVSAGGGFYLSLRSMINAHRYHPLCYSLFLLTPLLSCLGPDLNSLDKEINAMLLEGLRVQYGWVMIGAGAWMAFWYKDTWMGKIFTSIEAEDGSSDVVV